MKKNKDVTSSSRLILREAEKLNIDWKIIPGTQIVTLSYKGVERSYHHQIPSASATISNYICNNKITTSNMLEHAGIRVAKGFRLNSAHGPEYQKRVFDSLKKPLVVKPSNGTWGDNITVNISDFADFTKSIELAFSYSASQNTSIIVEEMFEGEEFRVLATREKVIGVLKRVPANVIGNGRDTIKKLINEKNKEEIRGGNSEHASHFKIRIDASLREFLSAQYLTLDSIIPSGKQIFLRKISNVSKGGEAIDFTDEIHPTVADICIKAMNAIPGLSFAGIDFMSQDITKRQTKESYVVIEINDSPGFDIHDYPYKGKNRHAAREFLKVIFPELAQK